MFEHDEYVQVVIFECCEEWLSEYRNDSVEYTTSTVNSICECLLFAARHIPGR